MIMQIWCDGNSKGVFEFSIIPAVGTRLSFGKEFYIVDEVLFEIPTGECDGPPLVRSGSMNVHKEKRPWA